MILASASRIRGELLDRFGLPYRVDAANVDEAPLQGEPPDALARRLSAAKAEAVSARHPAACVIGSDQVALHDGVVLGKPGTADRARSSLAAFSGGTVLFLTGLALARGGVIQHHHLDRTTVRFRDLSDAEIERYVERDQPLDCAGSFRLESLGPSLFESVHSEDPTALLGLPLITLAHCLRAQGYPLP